MRLRTRLIVTLAATAIVVAVPAVYAVSRLSTLREIASEQRTRYAYAFLKLGGLQTSLAELDRHIRGYLITGADDQRAAAQASLLTARTSLRELSAVGYRDSTARLNDALGRLERATGAMIDLMESGRAQEATAYFERLKPLLSSAQQLDGVAAEIDNRSRDDVLLARRISSSAATTTLAALVVCLLIAIAFGVWNAASVTRPILKLRGTMARVAEGDFVVPPEEPDRGHDEIGDLYRSFGWMTQQLSRLDQMKAEFISIATHELKTPINVISGYTELIEEGIYGSPNARQREALGTIREQTRLLTNLVNQLLDISRLEAGGLQLEMQEVVLRDLLARVERSFSVLARKKDIDFKVEIDPSLPRGMRADADRLSDQVIGNLLSNALKFTPEGGRVRLRAWSQEDGVHIVVEDSGVGVPPDQLPYIFDKYFQVGQQARSKGAGLGLAIAREIIEAHGGIISADSRPGEGTAIEIVLPIHAVTHPSAHFIEKTA
ncbi:MAG: ATP-binding protein [Gemmatimonadota bacterium]